jgi:hypothetical protein
MSARLLAGVCRGPVDGAAAGRILPILFIMLGLGELSKVVLIVVGIGPFLIRDLSRSACSTCRASMIPEGGDAGGEFGLCHRAAGGPAAGLAAADSGRCACRWGRPGCS